MANNEYQYYDPLARPVKEFISFMESVMGSVKESVPRGFEKFAESTKSVEASTNNLWDAARQMSALSKNVVKVSAVQDVSVEGASADAWETSKKRKEWYEALMARYGNRAPRTDPFARGFKWMEYSQFIPWFLLAGPEAQFLAGLLALGGGTLSGSISRMFENQADYDQALKREALEKGGDKTSPNILAQELQTREKTIYGNLISDWQTGKGNSFSSSFNNFAPWLSGGAGSSYFPQYSGWRAGAPWGFEIPPQPWPSYDPQAQQRLNWQKGSIIGGLRLGAYDLNEKSGKFWGTTVAGWVEGAPKTISTALAHDFIQGIKTGQMDLGQTFIKLGYSAAQAMIQKFLENWLNQVVPLIANSFANVLSGGSSGGGGGGLFGWISGLFGGGSGSGSGVPFSNYLDLWSPSYSLPSSFLSAHGNVFSNGIELALANGGIVTRPTFFPMARGWGLMGEAGPEAVMPLTRTTGGALGVKAVSAQPQVNVVINNNTQAQVNAEQQGNGDLLISIDDAMAAAYQRRGRFYQALGQSRGITR